MNMLRSNTLYKTLFPLAVPIVAQSLIMSLLNVVDVLMIGQLGEVEVAGVGLSNQIVFILQLLLYGVGGGVGIFAAQFWGKKDLENIYNSIGIGLLIAFIAAGIFSVVSLLAPRSVLGLFTPDPEVIEIGSGYLFTIVPTFLAMAVTVTYSLSLRSLGFARLPMMVSVSALSVKTLLGYLMIFGVLGFPAMGVHGAALSTLIARLLECVTLLVLVYVRRTPLAAPLLRLLKFKWDFVVCYLKTVTPLIINEGFWAIGIATYSAIYARISTESLAAVNILLTIEQLAFVIFAGIGNATAILAGNLIGENRPGEAFNLARRVMLLNLIGALLLGGVLFAASNGIISLYNVSDAARYYARTLIRIFSLVLWIRACYIVVLLTIRGGGDTRYSMIIDLVTLWGVGVPMALLGAFVFHLPVYWVYLMIASEELVKLGLLLWRFFSKKWIHDLSAGVPGEALEQAECLVE